MLVGLKIIINLLLMQARRPESVADSESSGSNEDCTEHSRQSTALKVLELSLLLIDSHALLTEY